MKLKSLMLLMLCWLVPGTFASVLVKMYSFDEGLLEGNLSKPRIYVKNVGTESASNIVYDYFFTCERDEIPVVEDYWTPNENVSLMSDGNKSYRLRYTVSATLLPGQMSPENSGCVVGLHYNTWSPWDKNDDWSNNRQAAFAENTKIVAYINGVKVYGTAPDYIIGGDTIPQQNLVLNSFALFATTNCNVQANTVFTGGGALGANSDVDIGAGATVYGNIISGQNAILRANSSVHGDVYAGRLISLYNNTSITGTRHEQAQVATVTIPQKTVTSGTVDKTIASNTTITLAPGVYKNLDVQTGGTLVLQPGTYSFYYFKLAKKAKVLIDVAFNQNVQIDVKTDLEFSDSCEVKFKTHGYAPAARIYTNDANVLRVGYGAKVTGVISAPLADLTMYAGSRCDGAIYAKKITVEQGASVSSGDVNPFIDQDGDGVVNYLEIQTNTYPDSVRSFKMMALPSPVIIDAQQDQVVSYDVSYFYSEYKNFTTVKLSIPAGSLAGGQDNALLKVSNSAVDFDNMAVSTYKLPQGYAVASRFFSFKQGTFLPNKLIGFKFPITTTETSLKNYSLLYLPTGATQWVASELTEDLDASGNVNVEGSAISPVAAVIVAKKEIATAYLDEGVVLENEARSEVAFDLKLLDVPNSTISGTYYIQYVDKADPAHPVNQIYPGNLVNRGVFSTGGPYYLASNAPEQAITSTGDIEITQISISITGITGFNTYLWSGSLTVPSGQKMTLRSNAPYFFFSSAFEPISAIYSSTSYSLESFDLDGEGRVINNPVGSGLAYDYYIKDHLGSTREIINTSGTITEATMYQPYGTMVSLVTPNEDIEARNKFTGKEYDHSVENYGEVTFDIAISNFDAGMHYRGELWLTYTDLSINREMMKVYSMNYDVVNKKFSLNTLERFPVNIRLTRVKITTSGITPIVYEKTCNQELTITDNVYTDDGINISMNVTGSQLLNPDPSTEYVTFQRYTPVKLLGSNLFYFGARYYDPEVGVWLGTDPISQYANSYGYCGGNPIILVDPNGMFSWLSVALGAGMGALQAQMANPDDDMAWLRGAVVGGASAAIGELAGEFSGVISDAIVGGNSLGKEASIWTELGVSTTLTMAGNAIGQGISIGLGVQDEFSGLSLTLSGASAFATTGLSIAKSGYLRDSRSAAQQYLSSEQITRFTKATGHDLFTERVRFYREGGYMSKSLPGYHISSKWGDRYNKVFNYNKSGYTFAHEMGHHFASTYDVGGTYNAYGFETYIMGNPNQIVPDEGGVRWNLGRPVNVNWERQRMLITPRNDIEFTNWGL